MSFSRASAPDYGGDIHLLSCTALLEGGYLGNACFDRAGEGKKEG